jgi:hypothetical protein
LGNVSVNNRVNSGDDEFVLVEDVCHSTKKTIAPKELNNINNKLKKIAVVQSFSIEECMWVLATDLLGLNTRQDLVKCCFEALIV